MKRDILFAPSILSADFSCLRNQIQEVEKAGADWLHIDVMDGHFVPNLTIGPVVIKAIKKHTKLFFDVHLMIDHPEKYFENFISSGADLITFHTEILYNHKKLINMIRSLGIKTGVTLKPGTKIDSLIDLLPDIDVALIMTVEPGFGGQKFMPDMLERIHLVRKIIDENKLKCRLQVDGGINLETITSVVKNGADVIVAGSAVFGEKNPGEALKKLKNISKIQ